MTDAHSGGEPGDPLLRAVAEYWDDIIRRADEEQAARLWALIDGTAEPDPVENRALLGDELLDLLPPDHPVSRTMQTATMYSSAGQDPGVQVAEALRWLRAQLAGGGPASAADILLAVTERLLAAPALSKQEVRQRHADPVDPGLLRLPRPDGGQQWPAFQFAPGNGPLPVVRAINTLLNAAGDPIGVADWWLSRNGWLDGRPSELLGRVPDDVLLGAARAVGSEL